MESSNSNNSNSHPGPKWEQIFKKGEKVLLKNIDFTKGRPAWSDKVFQIVKQTGPKSFLVNRNLDDGRTQGFVRHAKYIRHYNEPLDRQKQNSQKFYVMKRNANQNQQNFQNNNTQRRYPSRQRQQTQHEGFVPSQNVNLRGQRQVPYNRADARPVNRVGVKIGRQF